MLWQNIPFHSGLWTSWTIHFLLLPSICCCFLFIYRPYVPLNPMTCKFWFWKIHFPYIYFYTEKTVRFLKNQPQATVHVLGIYNLWWLFSFLRHKKTKTKKWSQRIVQFLVFTYLLRQASGKNVLIQEAVTISCLPYLSCKCDWLHSAQDNLPCMTRCELHIHTHIKRHNKSNVYWNHLCVWVNHQEIITK